MVTAQSLLWWACAGDRPAGPGTGWPRARQTRNINLMWALCEGLCEGPSGPAAARSAAYRVRLYPQPRQIIASAPWLGTLGPPSRQHARPGGRRRHGRPDWAHRHAPADRSVPSLLANSGSRGAACGVRSRLTTAQGQALLPAAHGARRAGAVRSARRTTARRREGVVARR